MSAQVRDIQSVQESAAHQQIAHNNKKGRAGSFHGTPILPKDPSSSSIILNALEEAPAAASERRQTEISQRRVEARSGNLLRNKEEIKEIVKKIPKLNNKKQLDTLIKEVLSHTDLTREAILIRLDLEFKDISFKYLALAHTEYQLDQALKKAIAENNTRVVNKLTNALFHVRRASSYLLAISKKRDILAGINIAEISDKFDSNLGLDNTEELIGFYRDSVLDYKTLSIAYTKILDKYGAERFFVGIDFLLQALGADMGAKGSSISSNNLEAIIKDIEQLRGLRFIYKELHESITKVKKVTLLDIHNICHDVMKELLIIQKRRSVDDRFLPNLAAKAEIYRNDQKVHFFNRTVNLIKLLPEKYFMDSKSRHQIIEDMQEALDDAVYSLEEETSL
jgi:type III secretion system YopN/LcrE/InvE/MxiC family regulator